MALDEMRAELEELRTAIEERAGRDDLTDEELAGLDADINTFEEKRTLLDKTEAREAKIAEIRAAKQAGLTESGDGPAAFNVHRTVDPFEQAERLTAFAPESAWREVAMRAVDQDKVMDADHQTEVERKLKTVRGVATRPRHQLRGVRPGVGEGRQR